MQVLFSGLIEIFRDRRVVLAVTFRHGLMVQHSPSMHGTTMRPIRQLICLTATASPAAYSSGFTHMVTLRLPRTLPSMAISQRPLSPQALGLACRHVPTARRTARAFRVAAGPSTSSDGFTYLELELPTPLNSNVKKSAFIKSSTRVADCPPDRIPEFAFIGRSNVGKSSLINSLTNNDRLAKVSKEPGKRRWQLWVGDESTNYFWRPLPCRHDKAH